jgi:hypothetical protein
VRLDVRTRRLARQTDIQNTMNSLSFGGLASAIAIAFLRIMVIAAPVANLACTSTPQQRMTDFESPEDTVRMRAFAELMAAPFEGRAPSRSGPEAAEQWHAYFQQHPASRLQMIKLLERENHRTSLQRFDEEFSEYYASLIGAVSSLEDPRAVTALIGAITTGTMATDGLAILGDAALNAVEQVAKSSDASMRGAGLFTLTTMLRKHSAKLREENRVRVKSRLLEALSDPKPELREAAINGMFDLPDPDISAAIQRLALSDTAKVVSATGVRFPVREAAQRWLKLSRR